MYKKVKQLAKLPIEYSHISVRRYDKKISVRFLKVLERERLSDFVCMRDY